MTRKELQEQIISNLILDENLFYQFSDQIKPYMFDDNQTCKTLYTAFYAIIKDNKKPT
jgi:hypothetical protein